MRLKSYNCISDLKIEGCNLVENSTRPDPTVNNFNQTRQKPDYFEHDPNPIHLKSTRPDPTFTTETRKLQLIETIITTFILQIYYVKVTRC